MAELESAIKKTKNKTSIDNNGLSNSILKQLPLEIKILILKLFNNCLSKNFIPSEWKYSKINMIPKKGDSQNIKFYRPISSTPCLMKTYEKIILKRLKNFLDENNILIKQQSGFRTHRQTRDNLYFMNQKILEAFGKKQKVCCIFFDIQAAFDKVWHNGLLFKLYKIKVPFYMLEWIKNFMTENIKCK